VPFKGEWGFEALMFGRDAIDEATVTALPAHVAIIMDGNGRWASKRLLPRFEGHRRGVEALRRTVRAASEIGIRYLTLYSFSSENWSRPRLEVDYLMGLVKRFVRNDLAELHASNVRVRIIGDRQGLDGELAGLLADAESLTAANSGLTLVVAFNYGARQEIASAARRLAEMVAAGTLKPEEITPDLLAGSLHTADIPDPDLVIRTSGEKRLSNFLLWQAAYAEFVFMPLLWPDFDRVALETALAEYGARNRRFGRVSESALSRQATSG
jgi:undecaprenyl diphosphate synthase